jgi:hypothetical protein
MRSSASLVVLLASLAAGRQIPQNVQTFYDTWKVSRTAAHFSNYTNRHSE